MKRFACRPSGHRKLQFVGITNVSVYCVDLSFVDVDAIQGSSSEARTRGEDVASAKSLVPIKDDKIAYGLEIPNVCQSSRNKQL